MRIVPAIVSLLITLTLIILLSIPFGSTPPLGGFISPQHGFWLNAEPVDKPENMQVDLPELQEPVEVYFDSRMVPHVFAQNDRDLYYVQGYLHAKFRLWQMEFQTHGAAGRISELLGAGEQDAYLNYDRNMRRLGMVYGAENSLREMEADPFTKTMLDAYTAGVNAWISNLTNASLPLEYRLLNYRPEKWTNLKTALFLMFMSYELTGYEDDIELSNARKVLQQDIFDLMYPVSQDSLDPIVPRGTAYAQPQVTANPPESADSLYFQWADSTGIRSIKPNKDNGSNNWAVNGTKTQSGRPILSNDPHLGVSLPSLWFEIQLTTPEYSVYGVSFPGTAGVIIGFNEHISWGVTNAMRDVKDFYTIAFEDESRKRYRFNDSWLESTLKVETISVKNSPAYYDTVAYTIFGPVMYDRYFSGGRAGDSLSLAVKWKAHEPSNELLTFAMLNRAQNYTEYESAIRHFRCPGQNFVFADKAGEIAIWQQGSFPVKWHRQGDFIMPGTDSSYLWQGNIPAEENPHQINPERGFVSSANQLPVDTTYPYYIGGHHDLYRGRMINRLLAQKNDFTPLDMQALQMNNHNLFAEDLLPVLTAYVMDSLLSEEELKILRRIKNWNFESAPGETSATLFQLWFEELEKAVWDDELALIPEPRKIPSDYTLAEALIRDSAFIFADNINTPQRESLAEIVTQSYKAMIRESSENYKDRLAWSDFRDAGIRHLLRLEPFSRYHLSTGGGTHIINATNKFHAPSWRMIVHLTDSVEAYGIYPGGQSGNPGSRYYDGFVDNWAAGKYYRLWFMGREERDSSRIIFTISFR